MEEKKVKINPKVVYISFIVLVSLLGGLLIIFMVRVVKDREGEKETETEVSYVDENFVLSEMNKENSDLVGINGGDVSRLSECAVFVNKYLACISGADYEGAYKMYATELIEKKGLSYSFENYKLHCEELRERMRVDEDTVLTAHYSSYVETENFIILSLIIGVRTGAVYGNATSVEYTLIKEGNKFKILDFSYFDFDLYSMKFNGNDGFGVVLPKED